MDQGINTNQKQRIQQENNCYFILKMYMLFLNFARLLAGSVCFFMILYIF